MTQRAAALPRRRPVATTALALCAVATLAGQTVITPPKNKYTPEQDVQLGREAAAEVRREYPIINDPQIAGYLERAGNALVEVSPRELNHAVFEYSVHAGQPEGDQRVCASGRPDVRQSRHVRRRAERRRGRRRHGPRARARAAPPRHGQCHQSAELPDRRHRRRDRRRDHRRWRGPGHFAGLAVRRRRVADEVQPRIREAGRPARRADDGARRIRSARSRADVRDDRETGQGQHPAAMAQQSPESRQPFAVHPAGGRQAHHRQAAGRQRFLRTRSRGSRACRPPSRWPTSRGRAGMAAKGARPRRRSAPSASRSRRPRRNIAPSAAGSCSKSTCPSTGPAYRAAMPSSSCLRTDWASTRGRTSSPTAWSWALRGRRRVISARRPTRSSTRFCARTRGRRSPVVSAR